MFLIANIQFEVAISVGVPVVSGADERDKLMAEYDLHRQEVLLSIEPSAVLDQFNIQITNMAETRGLLMAY
jgi:hypothetical protein